MTEISLLSWRPIIETVGVVAVAWTVARQLQRGSAVARHALWLACVLSVLAVSLASVLPRIRVPVLPARSNQALVVPPRSSVGRVPVTSGASVASLVHEQPAEGSGAGLSSFAWLTVVWAFVALLLAARLVSESIRARRLVQGGRRVDHDAGWSLIVRDAKRQVGLA